MVIMLVCLLAPLAAGFFVALLWETSVHPPGLGRGNTGVHRSLGGAAAADDLAFEEDALD